MKSCKPGKPIKKTVAKKPVYQPPKLATKNKWIPKNDEENSDGSNSNEKEEKKTKLMPKKNKQDVGRMTRYDKYEDPGLEDDPKMDYNTTSVSKKVENSVKKSKSKLNTNTVTTFSRMEDEPEQRNNDFNDIYGGQDDDDRVPCKNCGRKFNPDRLPVHQKS